MKTLKFSQKLIGLVTVAASRRQGPLSDDTDYASEDEGGPPSMSTSRWLSPAYTTRGYDDIIGNLDDFLSEDLRKGLLEKSEADPSAGPFSPGRPQGSRGAYD